MEKDIVIVEDSTLFRKLLKERIQTRLNREAIWLRTYAEAEKYIKSKKSILIAILDMNLNDAPNGEIIDLFLKNNIPSIVITSFYIDNEDSFSWINVVVDYVIKEGVYTCDYLISLIERFEKNSRNKVLVVDDSRVVRLRISKLLKTQNLQVLEAENGVKALKIIKEIDGINLVLTDFNMPECDGFNLVRKIRKEFPPDRLSIIGMSGKDSEKLSSKFIKYGANDFISKSYLNSQLLCRINQNLTIIDQFGLMREFTFKDYLTKIYNRRYLFQSGKNIIENALRNNNFPVIGMIDIDHFKKVNDIYGHDSGDIVLKKVACVLKQSIRKSDIIGRYGGEEFCIIANNMDVKAAEGIFNKWRENIAHINFSDGLQDLKVTVSIGLCIEKKNSFSDMIKTADKKLYQAKKSGRNRVCL